METIFTEIGVGGIFAILVVREVLNYIHRRRNGTDDPGVSHRFCAIDSFHEEIRRNNVRTQMHDEQVFKALETISRKLDALHDKAVAAEASRGERRRANEE